MSFTLDRVDMGPHVDSCSISLLPFLPGWHCLLLNFWPVLFQNWVVPETTGIFLPPAPWFGSWSKSSQPIATYLTSQKELILYPELESSIQSYLSTIQSHYMRTLNLVSALWLDSVISSLPSWWLPLILESKHYCCCQRMSIGFRIRRSGFKSLSDASGQTIRSSLLYFLIYKTSIYLTQSTGLLWGLNKITGKCPVQSLTHIWFQ